MEPGDGPLVGVIMGSDSDWPVMAAAAEALAEFGVPHEVSVVSAHRTPGRMLEYARDAADRGLRVIIAGAGGAAHLPGMVASATPLPVIGSRYRWPPWMGWTRCCPSCRCQPVCRWPACPSVAPETPACSRCGCSGPLSPRCAPRCWPTRPNWRNSCWPRTPRCAPRWVTERRRPSARPADRAAVWGVINRNPSGIPVTRVVLISANLVAGPGESVVAYEYTGREVVQR